MRRKPSKSAPLSNVLDSSLHPTCATTYVQARNFCSVAAKNCRDLTIECMRILAVGHHPSDDAAAAAFVFERRVWPLSGRVAFSSVLHGGTVVPRFGFVRDGCTVPAETVPKRENGRPKKGDEVRVLPGNSRAGSRGKITTDDGTGNPFRLTFAGDSREDSQWYTVQELELAPVPADPVQNFKAVEIVVGSEAELVPIDGSKLQVAQAIKLARSFVSSPLDSASTEHSKLPVGSTVTIAHAPSKRKLRVGSPDSQGQVKVELATDTSEGSAAAPTATPTTAGESSPRLLCPAASTRALT